MDPLVGPVISRRPEQRFPGHEIGLALLGIVASLVLAVLVAFNKSRWWTLGVAVVTIFLITMLYAGQLVLQARDFGEEQQRRQLRDRKKLQALSVLQADLPPSSLGIGFYGFEEIFALDGLQSDGAKLKASPFRPDGSPYPLEVHMLREGVFLVGYVSREELACVDGTADPCEFDLWMRRSRTQAPLLVEVPLARVSTGQSQGSGTTKDPFRLHLTPYGLAKELPT
jgi:hypothetical protein